MRRRRLLKSVILRKKKDIDELFTKGRVVRSRSFDLVYLIKNDRKVLFAVSRRITTKVEKNRIKRRLREAYRDSQTLLPTDVHLAMIGKPPILNASQTALMDELRRNAQKLHGR